VAAAAAGLGGVFVAAAGLGGGLAAALAGALVAAAALEAAAGRHGPLEQLDAGAGRRQHGGAGDKRA